MYKSMNKNVTILIDPDPNQALSSFAGEITKNSNHVNLTATQENITLLEKENGLFGDLSKIVYLGDQEDIRTIVETSGGISLSTKEVQSFKEEFSEGSSIDSHYCGRIGKRRVAAKIKKIMKLGAGLYDTFKVAPKNKKK